MEKAFNTARLLVIFFTLLCLTSSQFGIFGTSSSIPNCLYLQNGDQQCLECERGYLLSENRKNCIKKIDNCLDQNYDLCGECKAGYSLSFNQKSCQFIPPLQKCPENQTVACGAQQFQSEQQLQKLFKQYPQQAQIPKTLKVEGAQVFVQQAADQNNNKEPDIMRTDGKYIYTFYTRTFSIFEAYPTVNSKLISSLQLTQSVEGLFLGKNYVALFGTIYSANNPRTIVTLIDIKDKTQPKVYHKYQIGGEYFNSRLSPDGYLYILTRNSLSAKGIPWYDFGQGKNQLPFNSFYVYNPEVTFTSGIFLTVFAFKLDEPDSAASGLACLITQNAQTLYMSDRAIYVAYPKIGLATDFSIVHKIFIQRSKIIPISDAVVDGTLENQYSLDERQNVLRLATSSIFKGYCIVYCLDNDLKIIGKLDQFGIRDKIFGGRFTETRLYLSTFNRIDPFYVFDLSDPTNPKILGEFLLTGFSRQIYVFANDILLGFGRDSNEVGKILGLKFVLIDVSDVNNPRNISEDVLKDERVTSGAEFDQKALLLSRTKNTLIVPGKLETQRIKFNGALIYYIDRTLVQYRKSINQVPLSFTNPNYDPKKPSPISKYTVQRNTIIEQMIYSKSKCKIEIYRNYNLQLINTLNIPGCS